MNSDVQIISLISEEWENTGSSTWSIIVGKLHKRQKFRLFVLLIVTIYIEVLLESLVHTFCLSITFRIVA